MSNQDWLYQTSAPILAASAAAGLNAQETNQMNNLAWLAAKHKELDTMTDAESIDAFAKLDKNVQESLKSFYGYTKYNPQPGPDNPLEWIGDKISGGAQWASDVIGSYTNAITNPYRMARISGDVGDFFNMDTWNKAWDGNKLFDASVEDKINKAYSADMVKIGKRIAMGENFGEILSSLTTDAEFNAFMEFQSGSQTSQNLLDDFNDARISWGRDIAKLFYLSPEIGKDNGGFGGKLFNVVSGTFDLAGDIAFDPLTYVAAPFKAVQTARFGLMSIMKANIGELTTAQKLLSKTGMKFGAEAAFQNQGVRKAFDEVGALIEKTKGAKGSERAVAMQEIKDKYSFFNDDVITELGKANVKDADTALDFFKQSDKVDLILRGKTGSMQNILPRATAMNNAKRGVRDMTRAVTSNTVGNFMKTYKIDEKAFTASGDDIISKLEQGEKLQGVTDINNPFAMALKNGKRVGDRVARMFDRAIIDNQVFVGGVDDLGRSMANKSAGTVYTLARSVLPKYHAKMVSNAYVLAKDEGSRRKILEGIYDTIADELGLLATPAGKRQYEEVMRAFKTPTYGEPVVIGKDVAASGIVGSGTIPAKLTPDIVNDVSRAVAANQLAEQAYIPHIKELTDLANRGRFAAAISTTLHGKFVQSATDAWSALNLLPRLGMRSVIDETIFHYLTLPVALIPKVLEGYQASITRRMATREAKYTKAWWQYRGPRGKMGLASQEKDVGIIARNFSKFFVDVTPDEAKAALTNIEDAAALVERQLVRNKVKRLFFSENDAKYIGQHVKHGHTREMEEMSEGVNKAVSNAMPSATRKTIAKEEYNINVADAEKELGIKAGGKPVIISNHSNDFQLNMLIQLSNRVDRNGMIGKLAVEHAEDPARAVKEIADYLAARGAYKDAGGDKLFARFERARIQSPEQAARDMYLHVRNVIQNDMGELNTELLKKIRTVDAATGKVEVQTKFLTLDDLDEVAANLPREIMGYQSTIEAHKNIGGFLSALIDRGFQIADRQVATLSREPVNYAYYLHFRKELAPVEEAYAKQLIDNGMEAGMAKNIAEKRYTFLGNEMAMNRTMGFIDNPNVRSNFAMNARNLARYYRANEDFARRVIRTAKSPQALVRLRMTAEGMDHSGFIHEDQNGDKYFFFPVDEITFGLYSGVIKGITGQDVNEVAPLTLTGKVKMLSPSLDPESAMPTFGGPLAAVLFNTVKTFMPPEYVNATEKTLFGPYAENRDLYDSMMPSVLRKVIEVAKATSNNQMSDQITSAAMKSAAFYTANGMGPGPDATASEREMFKNSVMATARNIVAVRNLLGIFSPVSPTIMENADVPPALLEEGVVSFKSEFQQLLNAESKKGNPNPYDEAIMKWTRLHPGRLVYTVPETESNKVATIKQTKEAVGWMKANQDIVNKYPQAVSFILPQAGEFDMASYSYLKAEGIIEYKPLENYFEEIANVQAENEYYDLRKKYSDMIASVPTQTEASRLAAEYEDKRQQFLKDKPYFKLSQEKNQGNQKKIDALTDLRDLLDSGSIESSATNDLLRSMISEYDSYSGLIGGITTNTTTASNYKDMLVSEAVNKLQAMAGTNKNAVLLYDKIFSRLLGQ